MSLNGGIERKWPIFVDCPSFTSPCQSSRDTGRDDLGLYGFSRTELPFRENGNDSNDKRLTLKNKSIPTQSEAFGHCLQPL